ncbi:MAG: hypothetical protein U1F54_20130 [Burkholderiales bacterium]
MNSMLSTAPDIAETKAIAEQAYIYGFPLATTQHTTPLPTHEEMHMIRKTVLIGTIATALVAAYAYAQMPIVDAIAGKVVQKYQSSTCEQLWQNRGKTPGPEEQRVLGFLKNDAAARQEFFNKISGPVMNKMFECGMIP